MSAFLWWSGVALLIGAAAVCGIGIATGQWLVAAAMAILTVCIATQLADL